MTVYGDHCKPLPARRRAVRQAEPAPEGKTAQRWIDLAAEYDAYIVGGYAEQDGELPYNSSILVGPDGYVGTHRKVHLHLWNEEKLWFEPGDEVAVFETTIGRIGMQICYDQWFPELTRIQAGKGADIIAEPTNWVPINEYERSGQMDADELARANYPRGVERARQHGVVRLCRPRRYRAWAAVPRP